MADQIILLAHGAGGMKSAELLQDVFLPEFGNSTLAQLGDAAVIEHPGGKVAFTTDSFVIDPIEFPGGNIGKLAICGTVNDLAAAGATPLAISAAFILEEGLPYDVLRRIVAAMARTAEMAGVPIVTGDTKVVPRGSADKIFINTTGIGSLPTDRPLPAPDRATPGDAIILSGTIADHGMAIMTSREGLVFPSAIESDCAPLAQMVAAVMAAVPDIHCMRDPTRGGLAAVLNELAGQSKVGMEVVDADIPVNADVRVACELLGIDPLHVANEGKMVLIVPAESADAALAALQSHPLGKNASIIGQVTDKPVGRVHLRTALGSLRILDIPAGDILPRIC
ncbi:MAG: hydrogenase expression/formation protein HypE [bacterium]